MATTTVRIGDRMVGHGRATFIIAEIGINHNGSVDLARALIDGAARAGCDAVKFQKRTPELCVPPSQWHLERDTPWGRMSYIDYRRRIELDLDAYAEIDRHCRRRGILWTASCWDEPSVTFIEQFEPPFLKAASASLTDRALLSRMRATGRPLILSTGMSTMGEISAAVTTHGAAPTLLAHSTSSYPCAAEELNLSMIATLRAAFPALPVGYSGHESGLSTTVAAVALGACFVERHITIDRTMWGTDQRASVELAEMASLVTSIREVERALGDGVKRVYPSELGQRAKLRRVASAIAVPLDGELTAHGA